MRRLVWLLVLGAFIASAYAAKVTVDVTTATQGYNASTSSYISLSSITQIRVTWGSCAPGATTGGPASEQASSQAQAIVQPSAGDPRGTPGATVAVATFPVGLSPICFLAYNSDTSGESGPTNVLVYTPIGVPAQPITLGQPIVLSSSSSSSSSSSCSGTACR